MAAGPEPPMVEDARELIRLLVDAGVDVMVEETLAPAVQRPGVPLKRMSVDLLILVGSDTTLLTTLLKIGKRETPILPVASHGQPDFLFDVTVTGFQEILEDVTNRRWTEERRTRLAVTINGMEAPPLLNEIAVFPRASATLLQYSLFLDGEHSWTDTSDGLIIATPTGSTAYALSVGGPIVLSPAPVFVIIPVNSANPARRPLVVSDTTRIEIRDIVSRVKAEAIMDGQIRRAVEGKTITVVRSETDAVFVKLSEERVADLQGKLRKKVEIFDRVAQELPPSAKLVLKVLEYREEMTQREIVEETKLPPRTVRYALSMLIKEGLVTKRLSLQDTRQGLFRLAASTKTGIDKTSMSEDSGKHV